VNCEIKAFNGISLAFSRIGEVLRRFLLLRVQGTSLGCGVGLRRDTWKRLEIVVKGQFEGVTGFHG
jgi:hypothetical protein